MEVFVGFVVVPDYGVIVVAVAHAVHVVAGYIHHRFVGYVFAGGEVDRRVKSYRVEFPAFASGVQPAVTGYVHIEFFSDAFQVFTC